MLDREAENLAAGNRNPTRQRVRLGAKRDGTLTAIDGRHRTQPVGAYMAGGEASDVRRHLPDALPLPERAHRADGRLHQHRPGGRLPGARLRRGRVRARVRRWTSWRARWRSTRSSCGSATTPSEDQQQDKPYTSPEALRRCYERGDARRSAGASDRKPPPATARSGAGIGFAAHDWIGGGGHPPGYAWVKLNADGTADVVTGTQDIGTGTRTGLAPDRGRGAGAADRARAASPRRHRRTGRTRRSAPAAPRRRRSGRRCGPPRSTPSGSCFDGGRADARGRRRATCSIRDGRHPGRGRRRAARSPVGRGHGEDRAAHDPGRRARAEPNPEDKTIRTFGAQCVEVEVDVETGEVTVLRVVAVARLRPDRQSDAGRQPGHRRASPRASASRCSRSGSSTSGSASSSTPTWRSTRCRPSPTSRRSSTPASTCRTRRPTRPAPRAIGEPPLIPTAPAIANAVFDAIGVRLRELPAHAGGACSTRSRVRRRASEVPHESIRLHEPGELAEAIADLLAPRSATARARPLAGGTDLLTLMKARSARAGAPGRHQATRRADAAIEEDGDGRDDRRADDAGRRSSDDPLVRARYPALAEAAGLAATPQLRNMATIGGNLLQRPRCWYFRNPHVQCWLKGGDDCQAREGENQLHAIFDVEPLRGGPPLRPGLGAAGARRRGSAARPARGARVSGRRVLRAADATSGATRRRSVSDELILSIHLPRARRGCAAST